MSVALGIIAAAVLGALALGLAARRGVDLDLEQWAVGGRAFGPVLVFVLMAGEIYTTFTFLGASGYAYGHGAPAYYIVAYACLAFITSYWLLPPIWRFGKAHGLLSQPDFFARKYDSRPLGLLVALVGLVALVPYLVLQFKGLGIIVETASYGAVPPAVAAAVGAAAVTAYVVASGVHGSAWTAAAKDVTILAVVGFLGLYLPFRHHGGVGPMFAAIERARPGFLALPASGESVWWFGSTTLLTALGFYMWPHTFGSLFTARGEKVFRQNAVVMPLYSLVMVFAMLAGFAAILPVPGLSGGQIDLALLRLSVQTFDPWFVGVIGAAGALTAMVPGSLILLAAATLVANNLLRLVRPDARDAAVALVARCAVPVVALVALWFTLRGGETIVALLLMGYSFVTQLFPPLVISLRRDNPVTPVAAMAGIVVGVATVAALTLTHATIGSLFPGLPQAVRDLNTGIVALGLNVGTMLALSAVTGRARAPHRRREPTAG